MDNDTNDYLTGQFLLATPQMADPRFNRALIYICGHDKKGAMGIIINRPIHGVDLDQLLDQLQVSPEELKVNIPVFEGGPIENTRGFVLHTSDYTQPSTVNIHDNIAMTATMDILKDIADGKGPQKALIAMGYAGWGPKQLDQELHQDGWLLIESDEALLFDAPVEQRWYKALAKLGIDVATLSDHMGQA